MNWIFWALLALGVLLLLAPIFGVLEVAVAATMWLLGGLLLIAAAIWAVVALSRGAAARTTPSEST